MGLNAILTQKPFTFDKFKEKYDRIAGQVRGANRKADAPAGAITDLVDGVKRYDGDRGGDTAVAQAATSRCH